MLSKREYALLFKLENFINWRSDSKRDKLNDKCGFNVPAHMKAELRRRAKKLGVPMSEIARRMFHKELQ